MEKTDEIQYQKMVETKIPKIICVLGVPTVISMLVTSIYNMADTYFVSLINTSASGAVSVVFSLMAIIQAIGFAIGMGSGSRIARMLGRKDEESANKVASSGLFIAVFVGIILAIVGSIFINPLMKILGATETILPYAVDYARYILIAAPIMIASFVLNNILRAEGKSNLSMIGLVSGAILNISLDPLLIHQFNLGISGAAIATLISQTVSFMILFYLVVSKKTVVKISINKISREFIQYFYIFKNGMPSFFRQGLASISTVILNTNAGFYGDQAVAAMGIVNKIFMIVFAISLGIGQGYQPVCGYNYGAKKYERVKKAYIFTYLLGTAIMFISSIFIFIFSENLVSLFTEGDKDVIRIGTEALRYQAFVMPLIPLGVINNMTYQSLGKSLIGTITSTFRQGLFFIPSLILLNMKYGLKGVIISQSISDLLTFIAIIPFTIYFFITINKLIKTSKQIA